MKPFEKIYKIVLMHNTIISLLCLWGVFVIVTLKGPGYLTYVVFLKFQNAVGFSKDDGLIPLTSEKKGVKEKDPNTIPKTAALVNGKYVTYTRCV